jgi:hypothetical protein
MMGARRSMVTVAEVRESLRGLPGVRETHWDPSDQLWRVTHTRRITSLEVEDFSGLSVTIDPYGIVLDFSHFESPEVKRLIEAYAADEIVLVRWRWLTLHTWWLEDTQGNPLALAGYALERKIRQGLPGYSLSRSRLADLPETGLFDVSGRMQR